MNWTLKGQKSLVTGGTKGIDLAILEQFNTYPYLKTKFRYEHGYVPIANGVYLIGILNTKC